MHAMHCHMHVSAADSDGALDDSAARSMHFANALSDLAAGGAVAPAKFSVYGVSRLRGGLFVYAAHPGGRTGAPALMIAERGAPRSGVQSRDRQSSEFGRALPTCCAPHLARGG